MAKYTVHCTSSMDPPWFPENSYDADTVEQVAAIVHNCTRKVSGIKHVVVDILEPDDREAVAGEKWPQ